MTEIPNLVDRYDPSRMKFKLKCEGNAHAYDPIFLQLKLTLPVGGIARDGQFTSEQLTAVSAMTAMSSLLMISDSSVTLLGVMIMYLNLHLM